MTERKTLTVRKPEDILALVPYVMGFLPEDSLVLLTAGEVGESFHARVDLPDDPADLHFAIEPLVDAALHNGVRTAMIVVYSEDGCLALDACSQLRDELLEIGVETAVSMRAFGGRYLVLDDECDCDHEWTSYDVEAHPISALAVYDGRVTHRTREELRDSLVTTDPEAVEGLEMLCDEAFGRIVAAARHPLGPPAPEALRSMLVSEGMWARDAVRESLAADAVLNEEEAARMLAALHWPEIRDVLWAEIRRVGARKQVSFWTDLVRRAPLEYAAPPAALLAFAAYMAGEGALAWCALDRSREADPDYPMAAVLAASLQAAVPPSAWKPVDPATLTLFATPAAG